MINYIKSEHYRLLRKKGLYVTSVIGLALIVAAAAVLYFTQNADPDFPYGTSLFFYSNVIGSGLLLMIIGLLFNLTLTGKDTAIVKQSISFGVSRNTIFWSKLMLTFIYFLLICVMGLALTIVLGERLLISEDQSVMNFLIASLNMVPIVVSGFFLIHVLKMLKVGDVYILIMLLFLFLFSGDLVRILFQSISGMNELYTFAPSTLLNENLMSFMAQDVQSEYRPWLTGIVMSVIVLLIGSRRFAKQEIH
ncbi:ABC transporter permease [Bacillus horti]|uniref:ABC-2 type transport system permease protein n=1 Tax=Caldalkalibacillus horti TaxID=77523 RepID=A0ABT9VVH4_9BACI|nr:ABC transporter permease [Bacillus horti]MDQ0164837.1 ABC-2 type transport system permease protein [Bacillus horti]